MSGERRFSTLSEGSRSATRSDRDRVSFELSRPKKYLDPDYVWCDAHGTIHDADMDHFGPEDRCDRNYSSTESPWRRVFVERLKGDWPHGA